MSHRTGTAPDLAIAVCQAGSVGSLAAGPLPADVVRGLIKAFKAATGGPLNVNFITILANETQIRVSSTRVSQFACLIPRHAVVSN